MNIIGRKSIFLSLSGILVIVSIVSVIALGLKQGIEFTGGTLWQVKAAQGQMTLEDIQKFVASEPDIKDAIVTPELQTQSFIIRSHLLSEADHQKYLGILTQRFGEIDELRFDAIGPSVGAELRAKSLRSFFFVIIAISLYVTFAFRKVSHPVKSYKYGIITLVTLFHDAVIPLGLMAFLGYAYGIEAGVNLIVAILVVMGFSVHDTIVVFDRIRENLRLGGSKSSFHDIVNASVNQTMVRSINTSLTLVLVLLAMLVFGPSDLRYFILLVLLGVIVGTYSSIFVASPLLTMWHRKEGK